MNHFEITEWVDYARGLTDAQGRAAMERHLSSGCVRCDKTSRILKLVATVAGEDAGYQPPFHLMHNARAIYALQHPVAARSFSRFVTRLIYDSSQDAMPAGVRSRSRITRHALYEAENYSLDLRLEQQRGAARVTLVGQLANRDEPGKPLSGVPVFLMAGRKIMGRATGNAFGEFQMEYQPKQRLHLSVQPDSGTRKRIVVSLSRFNSPDVTNRQRPVGKSLKKNKGPLDRLRAR